MVASSLIKEFFMEFEVASNGANVQENAKQFSEIFMHADPDGVQAVPRDTFIAAIAKRKDFFDSLGKQTTQLTVTDEIKLNESYILAKVLVDMSFLHQDNQVHVKQTASYIVKIDGKLPEIVFYLNDQRLTDILVAQGLVPK
jgi:hypothetical protein